MRTLLARMPLYFGERLGLVAIVVASREARKASNNVKCAAYTTMHKQLRILMRQLIVDGISCI